MVTVCVCVCVCVCERACMSTNLRYNGGRFLQHRLYHLATGVL